MSDFDAVDDKSLIEQRIQMLQSVRRFIKQFADRSVEDIQFVMTTTGEAFQEHLDKKLMRELSNADLPSPVQRVSAELPG